MRGQQRIEPAVLRPRQLVPQALALALREFHRSAAHVAPAFRALPTIGRARRSPAGVACRREK